MQAIGHTSGRRAAEPTRVGRQPRTDNRKKSLLPLGLKRQGRRLCVLKPGAAITVRARTIDAMAAGTGARGRCSPSLRCLPGRATGGSPPTSPFIGSFQSFSNAFDWQIHQKPNDRDLGKYFLQGSGPWVWSKAEEGQMCSGKVQQCTILPSKTNPVFHPGIRMGYGNYCQLLLSIVADRSYGARAVVSCFALCFC